MDTHEKTYQGNQMYKKFVLELSNQEYRGRVHLCQRNIELYNEGKLCSE